MRSTPTRSAPALASSDGRALIEALIPTVAGAELFGDVPESTMFPVEAAAVADAVDERRREFATVRHCARQAMRQIGVEAVPILPDADRAPRWPDGIVGSMTHCAGYRAAAVARSDELRGVGIDAEPHGPLPDAAPDLILRDEERARLRALADADSSLHWDRIHFCTKEAVYKAWFPMTRLWVEFDDVSTAVHPDGTFHARVQTADRSIAALEPNDFTGRWVVDRGLVAAATWVAA